jgi:hypothetical protein
MARLRDCVNGESLSESTIGRQETQALVYDAIMRVSRIIPSDLGQI